MLIFIVTVSLVVFASFTCSIAEASLYAVPWSAIEQMRKKNERSGELLFEMRMHVDKPIAAVLTLNTVANTAGATFAGAAFLSVFGPKYMMLFALCFTILILGLGEIVPKTIGVAYATPIASFIARPLAFLVKLFTPILWVTGFITKIITGKNKTPQISEDDIRAITSLSRQAGKIKQYEENFIINILSLDQKRVYEIMTPRTVIFSLSDSLTVEKALQDKQIWHFSRIPVYGDDNEDLVGIVERRALSRYQVDDRENIKLSEIMRPLHFVQESQTLDLLLRELLQARVHLFAVIDEYGGLTGVVSLEDVLEEILGREIVDESDNIADMRQLARIRRNNLVRKN